MPSITNGASIEVTQPDWPVVERPSGSSAGLNVLPVIGPAGESGTPDVDAVLEALEPPVALDLLYQNNII